MGWNKVLNSKGQTTVEYILLLTVISVLGFTVLRHDRLKEFFSEDSEFFGTLREGFVINYRFAIQSDEGNNVSYDSPKSHPSYYSNGANQSRFFGSQGDPYGASSE